MALIVVCMMAIILNVFWLVRGRSAPWFGKSTR